MLKNLQQRLSRVTHRQRRIGFFIGLVLLISVGGWVVVLTPLGNTWEEAIGLDGLFTLRGTGVAPLDVVIVSADHDSANVLQQPNTLVRWDRALHARLIHNLVQLGAKVIAFDIFFGVPRDPESDRLFAEAIREAGNIVLIELLDPQIKRGFAVVERIPPVDELADAAIATAPFPVPMSSAMVRQAWHFIPSAGGIATLPLVVFQLYSREVYDGFLGLLMRVEPDVAETLPDTNDVMNTPYDIQHLADRLRQGFLTSPTAASRMLEDIGREPWAQDSRTRALVVALIKAYSGLDSQYVDFYGPSGTIATVPYAEVLNWDRITPLSLDFTGKTVLIGVAAKNTASAEGRLFYAVWPYEWRRNGRDHGGQLD